MVKSAVTVEKEKPATTTVTVARGKSVIYGVQIGTRETHDGQSWPIMRHITVEAGNTVEVLADEVAYLLATGFIVDPAAPPPPADTADGIVKTELFNGTDNPGGYGLQRVGGAAGGTW
jgi:hypothetical protein